jgi:hypothetical protein
MDSYIYSKISLFIDIFKSICVFLIYATNKMASYLYGKTQLLMRIGIKIFEYTSEYYKQNYILKDIDQNTK